MSIISALYICARVAGCAYLTQYAALTDSHINLIPAFFQIRFLFFCLRVDLFASLSSSPARLSWGKQHFYGNKGA